MSRLYRKVGNLRRHGISRLRVDGYLAYPEDLSASKARPGRGVDSRDDLIGRVGTAFQLIRRV